MHSHIEHLFALLRHGKREESRKRFRPLLSWTAATRRRTAGVDFVQQLQQKMRELGVGQIATLSRPLLRDGPRQSLGAHRAAPIARWSTATPKQNRAIRSPRCSAATNKASPTNSSKPVGDHHGSGSRQTAVPRAMIRDDDAVIFFNFRADRARQMTTRSRRAGLRQNSPIPSARKIFSTSRMTQYDKNWPWLQLRHRPGKTRAHSRAGFRRPGVTRNLRCAETEKYAHVTYFFNGGIEKPFAGEERILVPSPKVATYDLKPEMSAAGITDTVVKAIEKGDFDAIIMNYANADMVGHSGKLEADDQGRRSRGRRPGAHLSEL